METQKLNIGSGRLSFTGFTNIDRTQIIDGTGKKVVDIVMNIEKDPLPYEENSVDEILIDNVLEHIAELRFVLNECHRVLKAGCILRGCVPAAGTDIDFGDPTHVRHFNLKTFGYFAGQAQWTEDKKPKHPKYADYGYLAWVMVDIKQEGDLIHFKMSPNK